MWNLYLHLFSYNKVFLIPRSFRKYGYSCFLEDSETQFGKLYFVIMKAETQSDFGGHLINESPSLNL